MDFQLNTNVILSMDSLRLAFLCMSHLSTNSSSNMNIFGICLTLNIQLMVSFNFINRILMWPLAASHSIWLAFLVLLIFWFWLDLHMAFGRLQWVRHFIDWLAWFYVYSFTMCSFLTCHYISLVWRLKVVAK